MPISRRVLLKALLPGSLLLAGCATARNPDSGAVIPKISAFLPPHPRLIATVADWQQLARRRAIDPDLDRLVGLLLERARADLKRDPVERKLEGRRLLGVSREFIRRNLLWAFAYRMTGDQVFLARARREMLAVSAFPDWNPSHYLDVAEMTAGLALGYDWLYDDLATDERATIRQAIVDKGIAAARNGHRTFKLAHNWSQVCIGGMVLGALAVEEGEPALAASLLAAARQDAFNGLAAYQPDGVYPEGPGYWSYGTTYSVLLVAALRSALGTDWGLPAVPGFERSAEFYAHSIGPSSRHFNFADGNEAQEFPSPIVYLARELKQPALLNAKREMIRRKQGLGERFAPLSALWWPTGQGGVSPPLHFAGQGPQPLAIWRSSWSDPDALWFAIKAGGAAHNHAHMDAGSFVLDLDGVRWARDLGLQDYHSLESQGVDLWNMKQNSPRWKVFRLGSDAHNTLTLDDQHHSVTGMATLLMADARSARIDLGPVLGVPATREVWISDEGVQLQDLIQGARPGTRVRWALTTEAEVTLEGNAVRLQIGEKTLRIRFEGTPVQLTVRDISQPRSGVDHPNRNTRQLLASAPVGSDGLWRLQVRFSRR